MFPHNGKATAGITYEHTRQKNEFNDERPSRGLVYDDAALARMIRGTGIG
jgi:hypothetical protein